MSRICSKVLPVYLDISPWGEVIVLSILSRYAVECISISLFCCWITILFSICLSCVGPLNAGICQYSKTIALNSLWLGWSWMQRNHHMEGKTVLDTHRLTLHCSRISTILHDPYHLIFINSSVEHLGFFAHLPLIILQCCVNICLQLFWIIARVKW